MLGAYGRALADVGDYQQALDVLGRAHAPDRPDWRILSAQGAVLDQMGRHEDAQRYYATALKIVPDEPSVLSNLGLSYALSKQSAAGGGDAERAAAGQRVDPRVRQNLALVVGLQGRFAEAESIARADLPPEEAAANVAYLRQMLAQRERRPNPRPGPARREPEQPRLALLHGDFSSRCGTVRGAPSRVRQCWMAITRIAAGPENDDEQHRQEEQDHRHRQLGRQAGGLLLGFRHAHVAVFLRHDAQRLRHRRAVALGLLQAPCRPT